MVKAYMHGYFIDTKLYERSKAIAKPSMYEDYQKEKNRKKDRERKERRITMKQKKPAVNAELAEKWEQEGKKEKMDDRFAGLFNNADFEIDKTSEDYMRNHGGRSQVRRREEDEENEEEEENEDDNELFEEDFELLNTHDGEVDQRFTKKDDDDDESDDDESESDNEKYLSKKGRKEQAEKDRIKPKVRFYGVKENNKVKLPSSKVEMKKEVEKRKEKRTMSLGERAKMLEKKPKKRYN